MGETFPRTYDENGWNGINNGNNLKDNEGVTQSYGGGDAGGCDSRGGVCDSGGGGCDSGGGGCDSGGGGCDSGGGTSCD